MNEFKESIHKLEFLALMDSERLYDHYQVLLPHVNINSFIPLQKVLIDEFLKMKVR